MEKNLEKVKKLEPDARTGFFQNILKNKKHKIFTRLEEAFRSFDEVDLEGELPPLPKESEIWAYLLQNALLLIDNGEFRMARHILGDLLRRQPFHVEAIRWMGWCFKQEGDSVNALKCYEKLVTLRKQDQDFYDLGEIYYELKQDEKARDAWLKGLENASNESSRLFDLHKNIGNAYMRLGDLDAAEENYNKAFTLRPQSDVLQVNLGSLYYYKSDFRSSFECFKTAVDINPYNDRAWCGVGLIARKQNDKAWAKEMVLKSLDINPENLISIQILVQWALEDLDFYHAVERVSLYSFKNQNDTNMIYTLAALLYKSGLKLEAELELEKLLALEPNHQDAQQLLNIIITESYEQIK